MKNPNGLICPALVEVPDDKEDISRGSITLKGAYHSILSVDVSPESFISLPQTANLGDIIPVRVAIVNLGTDTITAMNVGWKLNDTLQTVIPWAGILFPGGEINIPLGNVEIKQEDNGIEVWTSDPNGITDNNSSNDTLSRSIIACSSPFRKA